MKTAESYADAALWQMALMPLIRQHSPQTRKTGIRVSGHNATGFSEAANAMLTASRN